MVADVEHRLETEIAGRGHSSPIVWGDRIFLTTSVEGAVVPGNKPPVHLGWDMKPGYLHPDSVGSDHAYSLSVLAIDARHGKTLWSHVIYDGPMYDDRHRKNTYASPSAVTDGKLVYFFFESAGLHAYDVDGRPKWKVSVGGIAYDPRTGAELWRTDGTRGHPIPSSAAGHGMVYAFAGNAENSKMVVAFHPGARPGNAGSRVSWKYTRGTAYVASPMLYGDYLYLLTDNGITSCLDARTGEVLYLGGRPPVPATFTASPVGFADKIFLTSEDGDTFVLRAGPKHEIIRTNSVGEPVYASPALANSRVYIRGDKHLFAIK